MMKTILFLSSELPDNHDSAYCNDLFKTIDRHLRIHDQHRFYNLKKYDQPIGNEILDKLEENPVYFHYCGHGDDEGDILITDRDGRPYRLKSHLLEERLKSNYKLECIMLGSCNSDLLAERLKETAEYTIGFSKKPTHELVNTFYSFFYEQLAKYGSPYRAFWQAKDRLIGNNTRTTAGAQAILKSKTNIIMELLALREKRISSQLITEDQDEKVVKAINRLSALEGEARSLFEDLLRSHPFAEEVFNFHSEREKLSYDIAKEIMQGDSDDEIERFGENLFMIFEALEKVLVAFDEKDMLQETFVMLCEDISTSDLKRALKRLTKSEFVMSGTRGFAELLDDSTDYILRCANQSV